MNIRLKHSAIMLAGLLYFVSAFSVSATATASSATFTLNQLSKMDTAVLSGSKPAYAVYIPIPEQWQVESIDLNLIINFSPLLLKSSSLTLMVGDTPLSSIELDNSKQQPLLWKLTIPQTAISKKLTTARLIAYMKLSDDVCQDIENKSNWITLSGASSITYKYSSQQTDWTLAKFPYPFIHKDAPFIDKVLFYVPEQTAQTDFAPYFKFANLLTKEASWRGVDIELKNISEFTQTAPDFPMVILATPDRIDFSSLGHPESLQLVDKQWLTADGKPLADDYGFVWLTRRGQQPVLVISANSRQGVITAVDAINSQSMHFMATDASFFLAKPVSANKGLARAQKTLSFSELGYSDNVVFGTGQNQLNYQFNLPAQYTNNPVTLTLNYSQSPFLEKNKASTLSVLINGLPLEGVVLSADSAATHSVVFELPPKQLQLGSNNLTISFNLLLSESFCTRDYLSPAWGTIYNSSFLRFAKTSSPMPDQIKLYPDLLVGEVLVGLPDDPAVYQNQHLLRELIHFASILSQSSSLQVMSGAALSQLHSLNNQVYFMSATADTAMLDSLKQRFKSLLNNLNQSANTNLQSIDKDIFNNAFVQKQDVGFVAINPVDREKNTSQLTLYGYSADELALATGLVTNRYKLSLLSGDLAVAFQNGTFTTLSSQEIDDSVQREVAIERGGRLTKTYLLYATGLVLIGLLIYIIRRRTR